jgi:hypothetical protein
MSEQSNNDSQLRLYAWQPDECHGPLSFFVMARSEEEAKRFVVEHVRKNRMDYPSPYFLPPFCGGEDPYVLTVAGVGEVLTNDND